jgi:hypothetical protein
MFAFFGGKPRPRQAAEFRPTLEFLEGRTAPSQLGGFTLPPPDLSSATIASDAQQLKSFAASTPAIVPLLQQGPQLLTIALNVVAVAAPGSLSQAEQLASDGLAILHAAGY